ncbi:hypothetical protein CLOL250_01925 [Clostridium sp. L2-50]|nr:hypothetical protein CLOL250_01925 [Clostridium sp. L2-50]
MYKKFRKFNFSQKQLFKFHKYIMRNEKNCDIIRK